MSRNNYRPSRRGMPRRLQDGSTRVMSETQLNMQSNTIEAAISAIDLNRTDLGASKPDVIG